MSRYEQVALGSLISEYSERNRMLTCNDVYSVTNSEGFVPSTEYFSKEVFSKDISTYKTVHQGMFAYNPSRVNVGSLAWLKDKETVVVSPLYVVFKIDETKLRQQFLEYYLHSDMGITQIRNLTSGSVRDSLKFNALERINVPLPSVEKQERIITALDCITLLMRKRQDQITVLDKLAVDLFIDIFGDPITNPFGITVIEFGEVITDICYGCSEKAVDSPEASLVSILRIPNILKGEIDTEDMKYVSRSSLTRNHMLCKNDILFVRTNGNPANIARCAVFDLDGEFAFASYLIKAKIDPEKANPHFISFMLRLPTLRELIERECRTTAGNYNINTQGIQRLKVLLPDITEQNEFCNQLKAIKDQKFRLQVSLDELEITYNSILQYAFNGELFQ